MTSKLKPHEAGFLLANASLLPAKAMPYIAGSKEDKALSQKLAIAARKNECKKQEKRNES